MTKRKAYKPLYLKTLADLNHEMMLVAHLRKRLEEINSALVPYGKTELEGYRGEGPLNLAPLEFVAARAFIESISRFTASQDPYLGLGDTEFAWRGLPLHKETSNGNSN